MKMFLISLFILTGVAHAELQQVDLAKARSIVHISAFGELIALDGMNDDSYSDVNLPDGKALRIVKATLVQIANTLCDTATVKPTGGAGRVIYCIAK